MTPFVKLLARLLGIALIVLGVAGFVSVNLFSFRLEVLQNVMHLVLGLLVFSSARIYGRARTALIVSGFLFAALTVLGIAAGGDILGLFRTNSAEHALYGCLAAACLLAGFGSKKRV